MRNFLIRIGVTIRRRTNLAMPLLLSLLIVGQAQAFSGQATDDAFAALLSMPGAEPESGQWNFIVPDDFVPGTEVELIAYLAKKQKAGMDFTAYRHFGTLLHHAIRGNQMKTAAWLLKHGSDPRQTLLRGSENALDLGLRYQRKAFVRLLNKRYGMSLPPSPKQSPVIPMPTMLDAAIFRVLADKASGDFSRAGSLLSDLAMAANYLSPRNDAAKVDTLIEAWDAYASRMPPVVYAEMFDHDDSMAALIRLFRREPERLHAALARLPKTVLDRRGKAAIGELARMSSSSIDSANPTGMHYEVPAETWRSLWRNLAVPLDYTGVAPLAGRIQPELWPELRASGYVFGETMAELACLPNALNSREFKQLWPQLEALFPDIREHAPNLLLAGYRFRTPCWHGEDADTAAKLQFLSSLGVQAQVDGLIKRDLPDTVLAAASRFLIAPAQVPPSRLVDRKPVCEFALTDVWYRALLDEAKTGEGDGRVFVDSVQLLEMPGQAECVLLVGGWQRVDRYLSGVSDSFTGPEYESYPSCPDPVDRYEVWQRQGDAIVRLKTDMGGDDGAPLLIPVADQQTGQTYYLHTGEQYGRCHGAARLPFTFAWQTADGAAMLQSSMPEGVEKALLQQCAMDDEGLHCRGIAALTPGSTEALAVAEGKEERPSDAFRPVSRKGFIRIFRKEQFAAYQEAILALDKPWLRQIQAAGVPGEWTGEALRQVSDSKLSLAEKRLRLAWIFRDRVQLAKALASDMAVLDLLMAWLPPEDWKPVFDVISGYPDLYVDFDSLRGRAEERGMHRLACDLDHLRGRLCGETIEFER